MADAVKKVEDEVAKAIEVPVAAVEHEAEVVYEAARDFAARLRSGQLISFVLGQRIDKRVGAELHAGGAPVRLVK